MREGVCPLKTVGLTQGDLLRNPIHRHIKAIQEILADVHAIAALNTIHRCELEHMGLAQVDPADTDGQIPKIQIPKAVGALGGNLDRPCIPASTMSYFDMTGHLHATDVDARHRGLLGENRFVLALAPLDDFRIG